MEDRYMSKKSRADRNFKFETLQLHVGQETADAVTDTRASSLQTQRVRVS